MALIANEGYVRQPMVTMIGNKRKLIGGIYSIVKEVWGALGRPVGGLKVMDGFAGSGVVSRMFASYPEVGELWTNDLEYFSFLMMECFLKRPGGTEEVRIREHLTEMNRLAASGPYVEGIVSRLYAPRVTASVAEGERCFYTHENALIIDTLRDYIERQVEVGMRPWLLAPLLIKASIHNEGIH
jgi:adenine-specific DNA methylase